MLIVSPSWVLCNDQDCEGHKRAELGQRGSPKEAGYGTKDTRMSIVRLVSVPAWTARR
jgi:hypothetical protein